MSVRFAKYRGQRQNTEVSVSGVGGESDVEEVILAAEVTKGEVDAEVVPGGHF